MIRLEDILRQLIEGAITEDEARDAIVWMFAPLLTPAGERYIESN